MADLTPYHGSHPNAADVLFGRWRWWHAVVSVPLLILISIVTLLMLLGCVLCVGIQCAIQFVRQRATRRWWLFVFTVAVLVFHQYANMELQMAERVIWHSDSYYGYFPGHEWPMIAVEVFAGVLITVLLFKLLF